MADIASHIPADRILSLEWYGTNVPGGDINAMLFERFRGGPQVMYVPPNGRNPFGSWLFTSFELVKRAFIDNEYFTSHHNAGFNLLTGSDDLLIPVEYDPPEHAKYRQFMNPYFSRTAIAGMRHVMQNSVDVTIDRIFAEIEADGFSDVVPLFHRMMTIVWCEVMGAPVGEADRYLGFLMRMLHSYDPQERGACALDMLETMRELYRVNKGVEGSGLINKFVNGTIEGRQISETEAASFILFMFLAGIDTVGATSAWALFHLARHPEEYARMRADLSSIPKFIEEIFRRYAIVTTNRFVKKALEVDGITLQPGDNVLLATPLACIDERSFGCPMDIDPERRERHNAFGNGVHFCVGATLARAQLQLFFETWSARVPAFHIRKNVPISAHLGDVSALDSLPLSWG
jgi:cytochrome P450